MKSPKFRSFNLAPKQKDRGPWRATPIAALVAVSLIGLAPHSAQAQFVCDQDAAGESGNGATATNGGDFACGRDATANGTFATAIGTFADAPNIRATAVGNNSRATGGSSTAVGASAAAGDVFSTNATAVGQGAKAFGQNGTAIGQGATTRVANATAVGQAASATLNNSAAFGQGATARRENQQMFGTVSNTYTMPGLTSSTSRDAQFGPLELVTSDAKGNLATDGGALYRRVDEVTEGVAMAMAISGTLLPREHETFRVSGNWGNFEGFNALAFGAGVNLGDGVVMTAGVGYGLAEKTIGGRAGLSFGW